MVTMQEAITKWRDTPSIPNSKVNPNKFSIAVLPRIQGQTHYWRQRLPKRHENAKEWGNFQDW